MPNGGLQIHSIVSFVPRPFLPRVPQSHHALSAEFVLRFSHSRLDFLVCGGFLLHKSAIHSSTERPVLPFNSATHFSIIATSGCTPYRRIASLRQLLSACRHSQLVLANRRPNRPAVSKRIFYDGVPVTPELVAKLHNHFAASGDRTLVGGVSVVHKQCMVTAVPFFSSGENTPHSGNSSFR